MTTTVPELRRQLRWRLLTWQVESVRVFFSVRKGLKRRASVWHVRSSAACYARVVAVWGSMKQNQHRRCILPLPVSCEVLRPHRHVVWIGMTSSRDLSNRPSQASSECGLPGDDTLISTLWQDNNIVLIPLCVAVSLSYWLLIYEK